MRFGLLVVPLLGNPEPSLLVMIDVDRVGPARRREEQFGGLGLTLRDLRTGSCVCTHPAAERVSTCFARLLTGLGVGLAAGQTGVQTDYKYPARRLQRVLPAPEERERIDQRCPARRHVRSQNRHACNQQHNDAIRGGV